MRREVQSTDFSEFRIVSPSQIKPGKVVEAYYLGIVKTTNSQFHVELGWRRFLWTDGRQVLSSQLNLIVPLGYDIEDDPRLGYGRFGLEGSIQYGTSL